MRIKDSNLAYEIEDIYVSPYGHFYFFDTFVVSELHEGVHFTFEKAMELKAPVFEHYGDTPVTYISNRVDEFSFEPQDWLKFKNDTCKLHAYLIVSYNKKSSLNALLEKAFLKAKIERFNNLADAIDWAKSNSYNKLRNAK